MTETTADQKLAVLNQLFTSATQNASIAMSRWTSGQITLSLDEVREVELDVLPTALDIGDDLLTMVVLTLDGEMGGQLILTFDDVNGRQLAASLLNRDVNADPEWSPLEESERSWMCLQRLERIRHPTAGLWHFITKVPVQVRDLDLIGA